MGASEEEGYIDRDEQLEIRARGGVNDVFKVGFKAEARKKRGSGRVCVETESARRRLCSDGPGDGEYLEFFKVVLRFLE